MKTIIFLMLMFAFNSAFSQEGKTATLTVVVENIKSNEGEVLAGLYSKETFMRTEAEFGAKSGKIENGKVTLVFENVPAGTYGLSVLHDRNSNGRMDFEASGMPQEDYGISNNIFNPFGPPRWEDAKFEVDDTTMEMTINLSR
ncbi:DUF2141 domain-containing protein [Antarcticibacterium flavum]|uniref:DUF2141 domain-containing protein n=1 Tax=Antarcticibacterium flavum TaxID=2058175 RepID=A0A5B7X6S9_9FLAO|nr:MULTISPECIES: DUF2141 domain-containing protein [Antarcticibacterium]MCM4160666.1 hypothetical protein [Antarcticibacterium sp. W02-3]QCY71186.1 DUF2141 domain-containing protein [Antarcticibacterium flavum]